MAGRRWRCRRRRPIEKEKGRLFAYRAIFRFAGECSLVPPTIHPSTSGDAPVLLLGDPVVLLTCRRTLLYRAVRIRLRTASSVRRQPWFLDVARRVELVDWPLGVRVPFDEPHGVGQPSWGRHRRERKDEVQ